MDFPAYVPAAVRERITLLIEGSSREYPGWAESLTSADRQLAEIDDEIEANIRCGEAEHLDSLRRQRAEAVARRDQLAGDLNCLRRLAHDPRMQEAYALLTREFDKDGQWKNFVDSAHLALRDYSKHRDERKRADEIRAEIADAASGLAMAIRQMAETARVIPGEFYSIPELLGRTDNHDNLEAWRSMRSHVLGEHRKSIAVFHPETGRIEIWPSGFQEKIRNDLSGAWDAAPDLPALLDALANAARNYKPDNHGMVGAALASQQRNPKTEYLRAFGFLLTVHRLPNFQIALTTPAMKAMAIAATVVMNLPDVDVTYDDVRKVIPKLREVWKRVHPSNCSMLRAEWMENSGDK